MLGVKAIIAESFERIHRANLVMMGIAPLEYLPGDTAESLGLNGTETFAIELDGQTAHVTATAGDRVVKFDTRSGSIRQLTAFTTKTMASCH